MSSTPINIDNISLPSIGYYDKDKNKDNSNSYDKINNILLTSCANNNVDSKTGSAVYNNIISGSNTAVTVTNQTANYLACQLASVRNRSYDSRDFKLIGDQPTVEAIFKRLSNVKWGLAIIFIITIYLLINGFFGSLDLSANIFSIIEKNSTFDIGYWIGLLIGLTLPVILICIFFKKIACNNLNNLNKYEITNNQYGIQNTLNETNVSLDYSILILFVLFIYAFAAALLTIKSESFSKPIYISIIGSILFILALFIYLFYSFIPFFDTADKDKMGKKTPKALRLFINSEPNDPHEDVSSILSNQHQDSSMRKAFFLTAMVIFIGSIIFFMVGSKNGFLNGLLGSTAILVVPILWVFNFYVAINFFYLFPVLMIVLRFIRYIFMSGLYLMSLKMDSFKDKFSDDLKEELDNFKNYSPTWSLFGVDALKGILNMNGYSNDFSKIFIPEDNNSKNLSDNKYIASGLLSLFTTTIGENTNYKGLILSGIVLLLTIIISMIILFGVVKIQEI